MTQIKPNTNELRTDDCGNELTEDAQRPVDRLVIANLVPMAEAPKDGQEILAYHKEGGNFHPVSWKDWKWMDGGTEFWGMRWHEKYKQYDCDYLGWIPYPELEL